MKDHKAHEEEIDGMREGIAQTISSLLRTFYKLFDAIGEAEELD